MDGWIVTMYLTVNILLVTAKLYKLLERNELL